MANGYIVFFFIIITGKKSATSNSSSNNDERAEQKIQDDSNENGLERKEEDEEEEEENNNDGNDEITGNDGYNDDGSGSYNPSSLEPMDSSVSSSDDDSTDSNQLKRKLDNISSLNKKEVCKEDLSYMLYLVICADTKTVKVRNASTKYIPYMKKIS